MSAEISMYDKSAKAAEYILSKCSPKYTHFDVWVTLGSGLGDFANTNVTDQVVIPYEEIPYFPKPTVAGHYGKLIIGKVRDHVVIAQQGRWHIYEGHDPADVIIAVRVLFHLKVKTFIVTNAAGGVNKSFVPGDLMLMTDHINFMGRHPLIGPNDERFGARFPDMSAAYNPALQNVVREAAKAVGIKIVEGVYAAMSGPSYETPAEIRMLRTIGADAVGMSTIPEVIAANQQGTKIIGISCITNMASGILDQPLNHLEVQETANKVSKDFSNLVAATIERL